jgi:hypothetical protein
MLRRAFLTSVFGLGVTGLLMAQQPPPPPNPVPVETIAIEPNDWLTYNAATGEYFVPVNVVVYGQKGFNYRVNCEVWHPDVEQRHWWWPWYETTPGLCDYNFVGDELMHYPNFYSIIHKNAAVGQKIHTDQKAYVKAHLYKQIDGKFWRIGFHETIVYPQ